MMTGLSRLKPSSSSAEASYTLGTSPPRVLGLLDQLGLWGNLGVSLLGFTGAIFVLVPVADQAMSFGAALTALCLGTLFGAVGVGAAAIPGARTGAPAMVLLRGLLGTKPSYLPTVLNMVQLVGWTTFELVTISTALHQLVGSVPRWVFAVAAGVLTTLLALRPLGWIRVLRKYVTVAVVIALVYLGGQLLTHPLPPLGQGGWDGFWVAVDTVIGVTVSWVPLASDYSRHARTPRSAFLGSSIGYGVTQIACYSLGLLALVTVAGRDPNQIFGSFIAIPLGGLTFAVLTVRELDQSFADTYSTAVSVQNLRPAWDRRALAVGVGLLATIGALAFNISDYENFLILIGSLFVPLLGVLVIDYFVLSRGRWDLSEHARPRWTNLLAWAVGFVAYQLVNPGSVSWWTALWSPLNRAAGFVAPPWLGASPFSFVVAVLAAGLLGGLTRRARRQGAGPPAASATGSSN